MADPDITTTLPDPDDEAVSARFSDTTGWIIPGEDEPEVVARGRVLASELAAWFASGTTEPFRSILEVGNDLDEDDDEA